MYFKPLDPNLPTIEVTIGASQTITAGMPLTHSAGVFTASASGDIPGAIAAEDATTGAGATTTIRAWPLSCEQIWITETKENAATKANNCGAVGDLDLTSGRYSFNHSATTNKCMRCIGNVPGSDWAQTGRPTKIYVRFLRSQLGMNSTVNA